MLYMVKGALSCHKCEESI